MKIAVGLSEDEAVLREYAVGVPREAEGGGGEGALFQGEVRCHVNIDGRPTE